MLWFLSSFICSLGETTGIPSLEEVIQSGFENQNVGTEISVQKLIVFCYQITLLWAETKPGAAIMSFARLLSRCASSVGNSYNNINFLYNVGSKRFLFGLSKSCRCRLYSPKIPGSISMNEFDQRNAVKLRTNEHPGKKLRDKMSNTYTSRELLELYKRFNSGVAVSDRVKILVRLAKFKYDAQLQKNDPSEIEILDLLLEEIKHNASELKPFEVADVIWCLGKLEVFPDTFYYFSSLLDSMEIESFSNTDLAMIMWGHGRFAGISPILYSRLKREILTRGVENFQTRELCQIVWSVARTLKGSAKLLAAIRDEIQQQDISKFNKQDLLMFMWAYSEAGLNVKPLFRYFKAELLSGNHLEVFSLRDISQVVWAFANQGIKAPELFAKVERELLLRREVHFDAQSFVVIAWAFAHTDNATPRLFKFLEGKLININLRNWSLHRLSRVLWAFVKTGHLTMKILEQISLAMLGHDFAEFSQSSLEELVYALQETSLRLPPQLVSVVEAELVRRANGQKSG
ncbi:uncharacterized protein LOC5518979 [Nematostella vectensis]|uniref:uncharacterized protein LOC5518979 n=1 Tax=Nematostella vectensis TaxID=45351 RepID=UPI002077187D|nr:uncharacterized protein LOC5518979 [Nematostella vectensis]